MESSCNDVMSSNIVMCTNNLVILANLIVGAYWGWMLDFAKWTWRGEWKWHNNVTKTLINTIAQQVVAALIGCMGIFGPDQIKAPTTLLDQSKFFICTGAFASPIR